MRKLLLMLLIAICAFSVQAQTSKTLAVMVHVETSESPLEITLKWKDDNGAVNYEIYRKSKSAKTWGTKLTSLAAGSTSYTDKTVVEGKEYEYFVKKLSSKYQGSGYVLAGINVPMIENKGTLLLLVDNDLASSIGTSLDTLVMDLAGSGYYVVINKVPSSEDHVAVKARIKAAKAKNVWFYN